MISLGCAQDSKGTEPQAAATVAQPAEAPAPQNEPAQPDADVSMHDPARAEVPNGALNASDDPSAAAAASHPAPSR